jgi:hypothetical protein
MSLHGQVTGRIAMSIDQILRQSIGYRADFSITHLANIRPSHVTSSDGKGMEARSVEM